MTRYQSLDGWRGVSILLVLGAHLFPLGPKSWRGNISSGEMGMAIFFVLSGFLITSMLLNNGDIWRFLLRRFFRIVPLAWLVLAVTFISFDASLHNILSTMLFYANWEPIGLLYPTSHFWSLCVEMQFYMAIAWLVYLFREKALYWLPLGLIIMTVYKVALAQGPTINTYFRVDEILSGCVLALAYRGAPECLKDMLGSIPPVAPFIGLYLTTLEANLLEYFRPYFSMLLISTTLFSNRKTGVGALLSSKVLVYIASISYGLYVIHGGLRYTWLGQGETAVEVYIKRPLLLAVTFVLAHLSAKYYESYWIRLARKWT